MKFYSEILNKLFDSEEEVKTAEDSYRKEQEEKEAKKKAEALAVSKEKKELALAIDEAESNLNKAYDEYEEAKAEVKKILDESNKQMLEIITPAKKKIEEAQKAKFKAIADFNSKFGVYTTQYSGDRAYKEFNRAKSWINDMFDKIW